MSATKDIGRSTVAKLARAKQFEQRKAIVEELLSGHWDINEPLDKDTPPVMRLYQTLEFHPSILTYGVVTL